MNTFAPSVEGPTQNAPIRLSYHDQIHYNAVVDPENPTFGVGLGFDSSLQRTIDDAKKAFERAKEESEMALLDEQLLEQTKRDLDMDEVQKAMETEMIARSMTDF